MVVMVTVQLLEQEPRQSLLPVAEAVRHIGKISYVRVQQCKVQFRMTQVDLMEVHSRAKVGWAVHLLPQQAMVQTVALVFR
jgi:hypothetical protein